MPVDAAVPDEDTTDISVLTAQIMAAYCSNNQLSGDALPGLIQDVHAVLTGIGTSKAAAPQIEDLVPAVPIKRSVFSDYIVCLEDGKKMKMLKRYLHTRYGMTPQEYRERWKLPAEYPMVAPNYAMKRSDLAKQIGLGRKPDVEEAA
ncbi:MAG: MucR family transcriptional regulator [Janthinobacterium lividum]